MGKLWAFKEFNMTDIEPPFEYFTSFQTVYNCLIPSPLYHHIICVQEDMRPCAHGNDLSKINTNYPLVCLLICDVTKHTI